MANLSSVEYTRFKTFTAAVCLRKLLSREESNFLGNAVHTRRLSFRSTHAPLFTCANMQSENYLIENSLFVCLLP